MNAFTAVSLDPPLCQVTLTRTSRACGYLDSASFAVNVLGAGQIETAWHFAGRPAEPGPEWTQGPTAPVLVGSAAAYSCRPWRTYDGGDHLIVLGEVEHVAVTDDEPLLFLPGRSERSAPPRPASTGRVLSTAPTRAGSTPRAPSFTPLRPHAA